MCSISACFSLYVKLFPFRKKLQMCNKQIPDGYGEYLTGIQRQDQKPLTLELKMRSELCALNTVWELCQCIGNFTVLFLWGTKGFCFSAPVSMAIRIRLVLGSQWINESDSAMVWCL